MPAALTVALVAEPERLHVALSPLRRRILDALAEPASATQLAVTLERPRQQVNYHVRTLERAGLVELVEVRRRRGCTERIVRAVAGAFVVDPAVMQPPGTATAGDQFAAEHLVATAGAVVRDVCRMQAAAEHAGRRLLTFTIETDVAFAGPGAVETFTTELAEALAAVAARHHRPGGRPYRIVAGGHPTPRPVDQEEPER